MSSLKKLNGLQMGGVGTEGFPDGSIFQTKYGIPPTEFGRILGIKSSYIMWNEHTNKNKFDEFWNKVYLKYSEAKKTNPNLKLKDYTENYLKSIPKYAPKQEAAIVPTKKVPVKEQARSVAKSKKQSEQPSKYQAPKVPKQQAQKQPLRQPTQLSSRVRGCASREPPQYNELMVKTYNKLINCLDVGKDATSTSQSLNVAEHGGFMLNNVIDPLFGYTSIDEAIRDKYNFNGVGDKSTTLFNDIIGMIDPTITYIPIFKHIVPEIYSTYSTYVQQLHQQMPQIYQPDSFYVIQDAGYGPKFIFPNYANLFTFATILDTASFSTDNPIDLTTLPIYQIKQDILQKYSLDTCIRALSFQKDTTGNYRIHFDLTPNGTIDELFNGAYNPMSVDGAELFNRRSGSAAPIDATQAPPFYGQGNYNKNYYIGQNYANQGRLIDIQKLVLIKEMGDTLKAMLLDQLLSYTDETLDLYPNLAAFQNQLPFCRENCIITTNDSNLAARCLLNRINSIVTSGRNVKKLALDATGPRDVAAPFYRIETEAEILSRVEQLKGQKIQNLIQQNNSVIDLLMEISNSDGMNIYFEDKTINEIQRQYLGEQIINDEKQINSPGIDGATKRKLQTYLLLFKNDYENPDPLNFQLRRNFLRCILYYMAKCLTFVNERIGELFSAYNTKRADPGYTVEDLYKSFLSELARFRFESPFEKNMDSNGQIYYIYTPNDKDKQFCFLPKLYGVDKIQNFTNDHEPEYFYYPKAKTNYTDFSLVNYFNIPDINNMSRTVFPNGTIGSIYRMFNVRLEKKNFTPEQIYGIIEMDNTNYFMITPLLYNEIDLNIDSKDNIFNKYIKTFCISDLIYVVGWKKYMHDDNSSWIRKNDGDFTAQINKLYYFSTILDPHTNISNCLFRNIRDENSINNQLLVNYNTPLNIKQLKADHKGGQDEVFGIFRRDNMIEDTLVFDDINDYPSPIIAKQSYLNKEIAQFINEKIEIMVKKINGDYQKLSDDTLYNEDASFKNLIEKLNFNVANLTYELKNDLQMKVANYIINRSPIIAPDVNNILIKDTNIPDYQGDPYKGRVDDTSLHIDFWNNIQLNNVSIINDPNGSYINISTNSLRNLLETSYRIDLTTKYNEITAKIGNAYKLAKKATKKGGADLTEEYLDEKGEDENTDPSTIENSGRLADVDSGLFDGTVFQKYFQNIGPETQKPGLLTFHMLCYFPKIIFMVYSLLKYIEYEAFHLSGGHASYKQLKDILVKFYERDFSDQLNRIFQDADPTYDDTPLFTIENLTAYDNATAVIIDIAQQMYNVAGLFKVGEEQFKADLALFNTHVLKMEPGQLFLKIAEKNNKYDIEYLYGRLFDAEYYVCDTKGGPEEEFNSIRVFEKFLANGVYSYGMPQAEAVAKTGTVEDTIITNIPQKVAPGAPKKEDVGFLAKMLDTLGLGKEEEEEPMPVRKLNFGMNANENPTVVAHGGGKKTKKKGAAKKYKKTRKVREHHK